MVKNDNRQLLILKLIDRTAQMELRSWTTTMDELSQYRERPILLNRVRVTSYAGLKMLELLDGTGTQITDSFPGAADLSAFWKEPA